tara:strand:- start:5134 stop:6138 length:1005 start_codon:yes stop_codon:yes gene_type:complete
MKKILLLTALLSVGTVNAQIMKAEPASPVRILTLQDVEVQNIKNEINKINESEEEILIKYDDVEYVKEKNLFKVSNVKVFDKTGQISIPLRVGNVWTSSIEDKSNIKTYANDIKIKKSEIISILENDFKKQAELSEEEINQEELEELLYQIDMVYALAGTEELTIKISSDLNSKKEDKETSMKNYIEVVNLGKFSFNVKASNVYQGVFEKDFDPENLKEGEQEKMLEVNIEDLHLNLSTLFNLGKLRAMVDPINYKDKIDQQLLDLIESEKPDFIKNIEKNILIGIRDGKDITIEVGIGKSFKVKDSLSGIMMALMNPDFFIETFEIYIKSELK